MKTAEPKTASVASGAKQSQPFFSKTGEDNFFGKAEGEQQSFFNASAGYAVNKKNILQTKPASPPGGLAIGQPNDKYEQEADEMADKVVQRLVNSSVQTKCTHCEEEDEQKLQPKTESSSTPIASPQIESSLNASKGSGNPLPANAKSQMENSFGTDFSNVRLHTDNSAVQMNKDLHAQAFTHGSDIYFNSGKYDSNTSAGKVLLAHELTHVVQQGSSLKPKRNRSTELNSLISFKAENNTAQNLLPPSKNAVKNNLIFGKQIESFRNSDNTKCDALYSKKVSSIAGENGMLPALQKKDVLENDLGSAGGLTCPVSTEKLPHENASLDITFNLGDTALTAEDITNIAVFVNNWHSSALSVPVRIHGYASIDGIPAVNWPLSCRRAEALSKEMQKVQPAVKLSTGKAFPAGTTGIPTGFIQVFAHGETEEFSKTSLLQNRRVTAHVPNIPALPAKLAKAPQAKLKTGPSYKPNGVAPLTTNTPTNKVASFTMAAEFENDPPNGILASCGEIRQYIKWSNQNVDPSRFGHEGFLTDKTFIPDTWYEDRDQPNTRYGHRQGPHSFPIAGVDEYLNAKGVRDQLNGVRYTGRDDPNVKGSVAFIASWVGTWEFRLEAIDICNGNKVLGIDNVKVDF